MNALRRPKLKTIVSTDYLALVGALLAPIGVGIAAAGAAGILPDRSRSMVEGRLVMAGGEPPSFFALMAVGFVAVGLMLLLWRVARIRSVFAHGHREPGTLTKLRPFKDRAYVHYEYRLGGALVRTVHFVHQSAAVKRLVVGQAVTIAVDPSRPKAGFIAEIFEG